MSLIAAVLAVLLLAVGSTEGQAPTEFPLAAVASAGSTSRLLLPLYVVDVSDAAGTNTLFAVRNGGSYATQIRISYFRTDQPQVPQRVDQVNLAAKAVKTVNIRLVEGLEVDTSGLARGYVVVETLAGEQILQGDYFRVTPNEDFASGFRLVNIDPASPHNELCNRFSMRFLNGGGFDSATRFTIWIDSATALPPAAIIFFLAAYDEAGSFIVNREFDGPDVAFEVSAADLLLPHEEDFGAIELQFNAGLAGHVSAIMSASGRYSIGLEATCLDPS